MPVPPEAIAVLQKFLDAATQKDETAMRACLTKKTLESGQFDGTGPQGVRFVLGEPAMEADAVIIPVKAYPLDTPPEQDATATPAMQLQCIIVLEEGAWKFDLAGTMERMFSGGMEAAMQQAVQSIGTAMQGVTEALGETMKQAFGESAAQPAVNYLEASTDYAPEELLPLLNMTPLVKQTAALSAICREPVPVSAAIEDLLQQVGSDDRKTLINWFDDTLFEGWQTIFALLNASQPFAGRLKGIRIEPAKDVENRMLILDGSDLVYRMFLNTTDGYYNDEWIAGLLPGLLAALPEKSEQTAGHRLIQLETETADLELFKQHAVPRTMRHICELLGKNLTLEANFDSVYDTTRDTRQLYRWTLNRIHGALALACRDEKRKRQLAAELTGIRLNLGGTPDDRHAKFEDGILEVSIQYFNGEKGSFYERDLDKVLAGEPIIFVEPEAAAEEADSKKDTDDDADEKEEEGAETKDHAGDAEDDAEETAANDAIRAKNLSETNFRTAAASLKENEPMWAATANGCRTSSYARTGFRFPGRRLRPRPTLHPPGHVRCPGSLPSHASGKAEMAVLFPQNRPRCHQRLNFPNRRRGHPRRRHAGRDRAPAESRRAAADATGVGSI